MRKIGLATAISGLVFGMSSASAVDFDVTAEVENALEVTVVQPMSWGALFASNANGDSASGLKMDPNGDIEAVNDLEISTETGAESAPAFLSLGGQAPARGSVASNNNNFILSVPNFKTINLSEAADFSTDNAVVVRIAGGDPDVARFYMVDFTVGDYVGGKLDTEVAENPAEADDSTDYIIDPDFNSNEVEFGIGATIYTDGSGTRTTYEQGTYEGTFTVTASY